MILVGLAVLLLTLESGEGIVMHRRSLSAYPEALCNDGTPAVYYMEDREGADSIVIDLAGGGACTDANKCRNRCKDGNQLCTADTRENRTFGLLKWSEDPVENPPFHKHLKVHVPYCSSDIYSGTTQNLETGFYFHGHYIMEAIIQDIIKQLRPRFDTIKHVVLMGESAGGFGTALNCDYVADSVHEVNPSIDVRCIPDGGDFYPYWVTQEDCDLKAFLAGTIDFWQAIGDVSCMEAGNLNDCLVFGDYYKYITTPVMPVTSYEDTNHEVHPCAPPQSEDPEFWDIWRQEMEILANTFISDKPDNGIFILNCPTHVLNNKPWVWDSATIDVNGNEVMLRDAIYTFLNPGTSGISQAIDSPDERYDQCPSY